MQAPVHNKRFVILLAIVAGLTSLAMLPALTAQSSAANSSLNSSTGPIGAPSSNFPTPVHQNQSNATQNAGNSAASASTPNSSLGGAGGTSSSGITPSVIAVTIAAAIAVAAAGAYYGLRRSQRR